MDREKLANRLHQLPRRAIVAFATRCARRVEPLAPDYQGEFEHVIFDAIRAAESFSLGEVDPHAAAAYAAAADEYAARRAPDYGDEYPLYTAYAAYAAAYAARAAPQAAHAADYAAAAEIHTESRRTPPVTDPPGKVELAALADLAKLEALRLGKPGNFGDPIDPSESGPLGPLWPDGAPWWFANPPKAIGPHEEPGPQSDLAELIATARPAPQVFAYFDRSGFTDEEVALCLSYLSEVYRECGGVGLKLAGGGRTLTPETAEARS